MAQESLCIKKALCQCAPWRDCGGAGPMNSARRRRRKLRNRSRNRPTTRREASMPTRATPPIGAPCWVDLMTSDTSGARTFYSQLFGWEAEAPNEEFGGYFNFRKDGTLVAGCMARQPDMDIPDVWSVYLATDDARKTVDAAVAEGGKVIVDAMPVADLGTMAVVEDSANAVIGL